MMDELKCAKCGRPVAFYLEGAGGPELQHRFPIAFHFAELDRPHDTSSEH